MMVTIALCLACLVAGRVVWPLQLRSGVVACCWLELAQCSPVPPVLAFRWSADILDELLVHLGLLLQFQHLQQCKAAPSRVSSELAHAMVADSADELRSDAGKPCCCEAAHHPA